MDTPRDNRSRALRALAPSLILASLVLALIASCGGGGTSSPPSTTGGAPSGAPEAEPAAPAAEAPAATAPAATPVDLGGKVFATRCALCHGADGHGDGVASKGLNPKPRNFHDRAYMSTRTDAQLLEVIHKGKGAMPRWEGQLSEAEITAVLGHIRGLGQKP